MGNTEQTYKEHILDLTQEALANIISAENKAYLEREIRNNKTAREVWEEAISYYESPDMQQFWRKGDDPITLSPRITAAIHPPSSKRKYLLATAAAAAILLSVGLFWTYQQRTPVNISGIVLQLADGKQIPLPVSGNTLHTDNVTLNNTGSSLKYQSTAVTYNTLTVPTGLNYHLDLADGSKIWLNSATTLQFPFNFSGKNREIIVSGEAYLEVAPDPSHPFLVHLPGGNTVHVLGTTFNVNTYDSSKACISLVTGSVKVAGDKGTQIELKPGFQAISASGKYDVQPFDDNLLAWRQGLYFFNGATLNEVSKVITRWYGTKVIIDSPESASKIFSGSLNKNMPLEVFLKRIPLVIDVSYYYADNVLHFK